VIVARVVAILVVGLLLSAQSAPQLDLETDFSKSVLIISANENACYRFDVYLALSRAQQMQGLMFVRDMPETTGMLFAYNQARHLSMWMKNTYISLDILFIRADGTVSSIARNTEPHSLESVGAIEPLNFVLELNAGVTEKLSIEPGSTVYFQSSDQE
jgi:uncharacterized membrane protein (UPF0127 family)